MSKASKAASAKAARKSDPLRNDETVARNLRRFRIARGLSQTALGDAVWRYIPADTEIRQGDKCGRAGPVAASLRDFGSRAG